MVWRSWPLSASLVLAVFLAACSSAKGEEGLPTYALASAAKKEAYSFAVAHPEVLQYIPCYCGCVEVGHRSNLDCYIEKRRADGSIVFTDHGAG